MDLFKYCIFVIISCYFILYVEGVITETPFMSKKYIGNRDSFTMTCNSSSFFNPSIYDWYIINRYKMYRKVESNAFEELLGVIDATKPKKPDPLLKNIPPGRKWEYKYGEMYTFKMYITLIVNDATRADVGNYWCQADIQGMNEILTSSSFSLRPEGEEPVQIIDKKEIGNNDTFTVRCNYTSFRDSNLPRQNTVTRLYIMRQIEGGKEEYIGFIESFLPPGSRYEHVVKINPDDRNWEYSAGGFDRIENKDTIFIGLTFKDAMCKDAGDYWCALNLVRTSYRYFSPKFQLRQKVTNVVKMNPIKVTPRKGGSHNTSYNVVGDNVTMACTFIGGESMASYWSLYALQNQHENGVEVFDPVRFIGEDGCPSYVYKTIKRVHLVRCLDYSIFFCQAFYTRGTQPGAFASMEVYLSDPGFASSKNPKNTILSTATNIGMQTILIFLWTVLVICEEYLM